jgi:hypothetical protein
METLKRQLRLVVVTLVSFIAGVTATTLTGCPKPVQPSKPFWFDLLKEEIEEDALSSTCPNPDDFLGNTRFATSPYSSNGDWDAGLNQPLCATTLTPQRD